MDGWQRTTQRHSAMHHRGVEIEAQDNSDAFTIEGNLIYIPFRNLKMLRKHEKKFFTG